jgi:hypothetical protein
MTRSVDSGAVILPRNCFMHGVHSMHMFDDAHACTLSRGNLKTVSIGVVYREVISAAAYCVRTRAAA